MSLGNAWGKRQSFWSIISSLLLPDLEMLFLKRSKQPCSLGLFSKWLGYPERSVKSGKKRTTENTVNLSNKLCILNIMLEAGDL